MIRILSILLALAFAPGGFDFDKTVHDWGDVCVSDGPLTCTFTLTNNSERDLTILSVVSSCGCTDVSWTREPIGRGGAGKVEATFKNTDGPIPFDKTLTVYLSCQNRPVVLHLRGVVHEKRLPPEESYPIHYGPLALRSSEIKVGNLNQGERKSGEITVANIGPQSISVSFTNLSEGLSVRCNPSTVPAGGTARLEFTVDASRERWGKNWYYATPLIDGRSFACSGHPSEEDAAPGAEALRRDANPALSEGCSIVGFWAITKEDFSGMDKEERRNGPLPKVEQSNFEMGKIRRDAGAEAAFTITNAGGRDLVIYKVECESLNVTVPERIPSIRPGGSADLKFKVHTGGLQKGEQLFLITLYTNSPARPVVNLFINGFIL